MKNTKIVALVAAVALLVLGTAFASFAATYNWYEQDGEWRCADKNGDDYYDAWAKSGDGWYWLGDEGYMVREALVDEGTKYVDADGKMVTNKWVKITDDENNEFWMYFQAGGKALLGKDTPKPVTVGAHKYIFNTDGHMLSGWVNEGDYDAPDDDWGWKDATYYCGDADDGAVTYGWKQITCYNDAEDFLDNDYWFYFGSNGKKYKASNDGSKNAYLVEKTINGKKYAFDDYGVMRAEWEQTVNTCSEATTQIGSYAWFHTVEDGSKLANGWFRVIPQGTVDPANNADEAVKWFYAKGGKLYQGSIRTINGKKYGFNDLGEMVCGLCAATYTDNYTAVTFVAEGIDTAEDLAEYVDNKDSNYSIFYFSADEDNDGSMKTGAQTVKVDGDDYNFYFATTNLLKGQGITGFKGNKYYFNGKKVAADDNIADYLLYDIENPGEVGAHVVPGTGKSAQELYPDGAKYGLDKYALISKTGLVVKTGAKKDGNGYVFKFNKKIAESYPLGYWTVGLE